MFFFIFFSKFFLIRVSLLILCQRGFFMGKARRWQISPVIACMLTEKWHSHFCFQDLFI